MAGGGDARSPASSATACTAGLGLAAPSPPLAAAAAPSPALVGVGATSSLICLVVVVGGVVMLRKFLRERKIVHTSTHVCTIAVVGCTHKQIAFSADGAGNFEVQRLVVYGLGFGGTICAAGY